MSEIDSFSFEFRKTPVEVPVFAALMVITVPFFATSVSHLTPLLSWQWWGGSDPNRMEVLRNGALILAGFFALWLAWRRVKSADLQAKMSLRAAETTERGQHSDRFQRSLEKLESDSRAVRIAGIYQIRDLAIIDPDLFLYSAYEVLNAFLRQHLQPSAAQGKSWSRQEAQEDCQAALDAFGEVQKWANETKIERLDFDVKFIDLRNKQLHGYNFSGGFQGANFGGCQLSDCRFSAHNLFAASFESATLIHCEFLHCDASYSYLYLTHFISTSFRGCSLYDAEVSETTFEQCSFSATDLRSDLFDAVQFLQCDFSSDQTRTLGPPIDERSRINTNQIEHIAMGLEFFEKYRDQVEFC